MSPHPPSGGSSALATPLRPERCLFWWWPTFRCTWPGIWCCNRHLAPLLLCWALISVSLPPSTLAAKLYKYQDASGQWVFADRPVSGLKPVEVRQLRPEQRNARVSVRSTRSGPQQQLTLVNELFGPVEVEMTLPQGSTAVASPPLPLRRVVATRTEALLTQLQSADLTQANDDRYQMRFVPGDPSARHRPTQPYLVPFALRKHFRVSQGFKGTASHSGPASGYAVDIAMPEGTPVRAARDGVIMDVAFDFYGGGLDRGRFGGRANLVRILHDDGTMAVYVHLRLESVRFPLGARVKAGTIIAASGNTGYTSGPHLHFAVQRNSGMQLAAEPFVFAGAGGKAFTPQAGAWLTAF